MSACPPSIRKYSRENQAAAIRRYAAERGVEIVCTYSDEGKSRLRIDGRNALQRLIRKRRALRRRT
jgi:DNA invertase Pin-like site-specific DNA recombinase